MIDGDRTVGSMGAHWIDVRRCEFGCRTLGNMRRCFPAFNGDSVYEYDCTIGDPVISAHLSYKMLRCTGD